ncbi:hypothetical protein GYMLUDRAFT_46314 [Collybiopsis luxurians FD-317 M1]|uniref:CFEM domain-containing protein n=1 Tax=Collybiopsis luxurians FD-317 M1 TaxID=944289 RepID=A0A0D0CPX8_9AGAR|nr:hypothetical protein GYMLUDRAFT_46314 [Collybiopsis luxurians FD-317 M1]
MRVLAVVLVSVLASASASESFFFKRQQLNLPSCAVSCLASAPTGSCSTSDEKCLCSSSQFIAGASSCIESSCSGSDIQSALGAAATLCAQAGVTLDTSSIIAAATSSASASNSTATSPSATTSSSSSSSSSASPSSTSNAALSNNVFSGLLGLGAGVAALVAL